jgi:CAF1 family ribonuclease
VARLPDDSDSFRDICRGSFREIYDTKYMANTLHMLWNDANPNTILENCYKDVSQSDIGPKFTVDTEKYGYSIGGDAEAKNHEAAYDALMTGVVFSKFLSKLDIFDRVVRKKDAPNEILETMAKRIKGKVPLGGIKTAFCLTEGQVPYEDSDNLVFHCKLVNGVKDFNKLQSTLESLLGDITVSLVFSDVPECFVSFKSLDSASTFKAKLESFGESMISSHIIIQ